MPNPHISEQYDAELAAARNLLMEMGGLVEQQVHDATQALINQDDELATRVRGNDKRIVRGRYRRAVHPHHRPAPTGRQ